MGVGRQGEEGLITHPCTRWSPQTLWGHCRGCRSERSEGWVCGLALSAVLSLEGPNQPGGGVVQSLVRIWELTLERLSSVSSVTETGCLRWQSPESHGAGQRGLSKCSLNQPPKQGQLQRHAISLSRSSSQFLNGVPHFPLEPGSWKVHR